MMEVLTVKAAPIVTLVVLIITFPYIRRVYRRIQNPPKLGIISLYPGESEGTPTAGGKAEVLEEPFEYIPSLSHNHLIRSHYSY